MRKRITLVLVVLLTFLLISCSTAGKVTNAAVTVGQSDQFTDVELSNAVACVKEYFKGFEGCKLETLTYDEAKSKDYIKDYMKTGKGSINGAKSEDLIAFTSTFTVDKSGVSRIFTSGQKHSDYKWFLLRDKDSGVWKVDDCGY